jgi:uncharacterized protein
VKVVRYADAEEFIARAAPWLLEREAEHNVILGDAHLLLSEDHPFEEPIYLATLENETGIVGCAARPPPDGLTLTRLPAEAIGVLVDDLRQVYDGLPGLLGPEEEATQFARRWSRRKGCNWSVVVRWRWYGVETVNDLENQPRGDLRLADDSDLPVVDAWAIEYAREIGTRVDVRAFFERKVRTGGLHLWVDGVPRSLVAVSGLIPTSGRISAVYTPPDDRRKGYATAAVIATSRHMLSAGRRMCVLLADLKDPTANSIYQRIGYRPVCDVVELEFSANP